MNINKLFKQNRYYKSARMSKNTDPRLLCLYTKEIERSFLFTAKELRGEFQNWNMETKSEGNFIILTLSADLVREEEDETK